MRIAISIAALALIAAADAPTLDIARDRGVTVQVLGNGFTATAPAAAKLAPFEADVADFKLPGDLPPVTPDRVKFKLIGYPAGQTLLAVENGYAKALAYHAVLHLGGETRSTMVCVVKPGKRAMERWPFAVDRVELSALRLADRKEGAPAPCQ